MEAFYLENTGSTVRKFKFDGGVDGITSNNLNKRLDVCLVCDEYFFKNPLSRCKACGGCALNFKLFKTFDLDQDGKAYMTLPNSTIRYICPLKKW